MEKDILCLILRIFANYILLSQRSQLATHCVAN